MKNIFFFSLTACCLTLFLTCAFAAVTLSNDPTQLNVGARVLGMGRAFVGISDDPSAIFINPAGLGKADNLQLSSMSSKYLGEFDYVQASALYPTPYGTFGIGYGGSSINFIAYSSEVVTVGGQPQVAATGEVRGIYSDSALLIAYGNQVNFLKLNSLYIGGSLKYISQSLAAIGVSSGAGSGTGLSLGALYPLRKDLSLGLNLQNTLVNTVTWNTNSAENLPTILKLGLACNLLGKSGTFKHPQELQLALDWDYYLNEQNYSLGHLGAEWSMTPSVALRAGIDASNFSAGIGMLFNDFRFDYAYHVYDNTTQNATNYFSLSYFTPEKKAKNYLVITTPESASVINSGRVILLGKVLGANVNAINIQGEKIIINKNKTISAEVELKIGKNSVPIIIFDKNNNVLDKFVFKLLRLVTYKDITDHWAKRPIEQMATIGTITGYPDNTFKPDAPINRAEIASLLMKTKENLLPAIDTPPFTDTPLQFWATPYIQAAVKADPPIITGYPDDTFRPGRPINRAEGATLIARFMDLIKTRIVEPPFNDMSSRHWAVKYITAEKEAGFFDYIKSGFFEPQKNLTRAETAYILAKTKYLAAKVKELMDFNRGYE